MKKPVVSTGPFRRLQWRLTLSYTLVTVGALVVVELVILGLLLLVINSDFLIGEIVSSIRSDVVPQTATYLDRTPPDITGLNSWLSFVVDDSVTTESGSRRITRGLSIQFDQNYQLFVIDSEGTLLAQASDGHIPGTLGSPFDAQNVPGLGPLLSAVDAGVEDIERLYTTTPDGNLVMALPIVNLEGDPLGIVVVTMILPAFNLRTLGSIALLVTISVIPITLAAGLIGAVFGFLTARGLTHRIESLSTTADAWSRGDFSVTATDRSVDELGQLSQRLNLMAEQLQNLLDRQQEMAGIEERNRIARELHDSVKQQVFATTMQVGAARSLLPDDTDAAMRHLVEAEKLSLQSQEELAMLIQELRPAPLDSESLPKALERYTNDWSRQTGVSTNLQMRGERPLAQAIEQTIFRVTQEALANVARHSAAEDVNIELTYTPESVKLSVIDNGQGFDPVENETHGYGLKSMQERVDRLGGQLGIESAPGKGTKILLEIPDLEQEG
jgi:NarL family two-component system sensor histidine kinase LiaS